MKTGKDFDPRAMVLSLGILSVMPILRPAPQTILAAGSGILIIAILLGVSPGRIIARTRRIIWFAATIILLQSVTSEGSVVFALGSVFFTAEGILRGLELSACLIILLWGSTLLMWSVPPEKLVAAFETWIRPFHPRFGPFVMLVTITMNLVPWLVLRSRHMAFSFRSRGVDIDSGFSRRVRFLFSAALPLFASSSRAATQLAIAMESRRYDPSATRTTYVHLRFAAGDWILLAASVMIASLALLLHS